MFSGGCIGGMGGLIGGCTETGAILGGFIGYLVGDLVFFRRDNAKTDFVDVSRIGPSRNFVGTDRQEIAFVEKRFAIAAKRVRRDSIISVRGRFVVAKLHKPNGRTSRDGFHTEPGTCTSCRDGNGGAVDKIRGGTGTNIDQFETYDATATTLTTNS
jgi:hypothetical protein